MKVTASKNIFRHLILAFSFIILPLTMFTSCFNSGEPDSPYVKGPVESTTLIYAVATNNLVYNLFSDKQEMLAAAKDIDINRNLILLYESTLSNGPLLKKLVKNKDNTYEFETIKDYTTDKSSVDPERIQEVINDAVSYVDSRSIGLVLWSHGTGIDYYPGATIKNIATLPTEGSFGYDRDPDNTSVHYEINIDDLADALPDNLFEYIWFDACYMGSIEVAYELRNKCKYFVGYPTEVFEIGAAYDLVLPYIARKEPDLIGGAEAFFNFYAHNSTPSARVATVGVVNMEEIENVADYVAEVNSNYSYPSRTSDLQTYTRGSIGPFYDFGQVLSVTASQGEDYMISEEINDLLDKFIIYKAVTDMDFDGRPFYKEKYSGLSCHLHDPIYTSQKEKYYQTLDWYKRVFPGNKN